MDQKNYLIKTLFLLFMSMTLAATACLGGDQQAPVAPKDAAVQPTQPTAVPDSATAAPTAAAVAPKTVPAAAAEPADTEATDQQATAATQPSDVPVAFFLQVTTPEDESVLDGAFAEVTGRTTPDAVVSVAGEPAEVNSEGIFTVTVQLLEGPNVLEVVASDFDGEKAEQIITVIYAP